MPISFQDIKAGVRLRGLVAAADVEVVAVTEGDQYTVVYKTVDDALGQRLVSQQDLEKIDLVTGARWTFDAPGAEFKLAAEARRIQLSHLFDPYSAVASATIQPLPHQIEAVYQRLLPMQPLHFLLADDPGAGKTIMSGLYIRELVLRGDLERCLIIAPGSLVEQWQEELDQKFGLRFDILSNDMIEAARTGNPFIERKLLICRLDQLSRNEPLMLKLDTAEWDLIIFDEAHKLSARIYGDEVKRTLRFGLAERVRNKTRNLLLLTATPHNGSNEDFLTFMTLIDPDRFTGRLRDEVSLPDVQDVMRRYVKENLRTFEGRPLFPPRDSTTVKYNLSPEEMALYDAVTDYVKQGINRAMKDAEGAERRRGMAIGFALTALQRRLASSPDAIYHSLRRRRERMEKELALAESTGRALDVVRADLSRQVEGEIDLDDYDDDEFEKFEDEFIEEAFSAKDIAELKAEIVSVKGLEEMAKRLRESGIDRKWNELRDILTGPVFNNPDDVQKLIIFSEHRDTVNYLVGKTRTILGNLAIVEIHGGMGRDARRAVQEQFRTDPQVKVLIATDAAGEGVNLQRANLVINYDLPWNPNRIEQRFGRVHRIGQTRPCHLWNMVAHGTREGKVFEKLFEKIEEQRKVYGEQIYDVLGNAEINKRLYDLLSKAIQADTGPDADKWANDIVQSEIIDRAKKLIDEQALAPDVLEPNGIAEIRRQMELALARRLAPGFIGAFAEATLTHFGGNIVEREKDRFQVKHTPAKLRAQDLQARIGGLVMKEYERVTFDKDRVVVDGDPLRADLVAPGHPLLDALIALTLDQYGSRLSTGTAFIDPADDGDKPRVLISLEHSITDGRLERGERKTVSRRFQFVEIREDGHISDPGSEPYLNYEPLRDDQRQLLSRVNTSWATTGIEDVAKRWAIDNLASPHFEGVRTVVQARVARTRVAVEQRLNREIQHWDTQAYDLKQKELQGKKTQLASGQARLRADDLAARKERRLKELAQEEDVANQPPTVVAAALVIPQGLINRLLGAQVNAPDQDVIDEIDRRAVAAVIAAEKKLGRIPVEQAHNNPGFDILSEDPITKTIYFIEVKGHGANSDEVKVRAAQVRKAQMHPDRFRLAIVAIPADPDNQPCDVSYHLRPFDGFKLHFAQTYVPLSIDAMRQIAVSPQ
jgi:SNF2 family DNA or RNA helicase